MAAAPLMQPDVILNHSPTEMKAVSIQLAEFSTFAVRDLMSSCSTEQRVRLNEGSFELEATGGLVVPLHMAVFFCRKPGWNCQYKRNYLEVTVTTPAKFDKDTPVKWRSWIRGDDGYQEASSIRDLATGENSATLELTDFGSERACLKAANLSVGIEFKHWDWAKSRSGTALSTLQNNLGALKLDSDLSDFTLISKEGKRFPCSRVILAARSDFFRAMFRHEKDKRELKLEECAQGALSIIHAWAYSGDFAKENVLGRDLLDALVLADSWLMADLFCKCEAELAKRLEKCNAELILDGIEGIQRATRLKAQCIKVLSAPADSQKKE